MAKTLTGGALISYGPLLPSATTTPDGSLFYKTSNSGSGAPAPGEIGYPGPDAPQGLYILSFVEDNLTSGFGKQVAQVWRPASATDVDAATLDGFDSSYFQPADADLLALANTSTTGVYVRTGAGSSVTRSIAVSGAGLSVSNGSGVLGNPTVTLTESSLTLQNLGGVLTIAKGGTNISTATQGGIVFGASTTAMGFTAAGTTGQVLLSAGTGTPTWAAQSTLSVGSATTANTANSATTASSATTAATLSPGRTIALTGAVTGGPTLFDGSANISIAISSGTLVLRAGDTMTGNLAVGGGGVGAATITIGTGSITGSIEFKDAAGTRLGYIGQATGTNLNYLVENGVTTHNFTGAIVASGDITAFSDIRLKKNIFTIESALDKVQSLNGVTFTRKSDQRRGTGLIAQEVQAVLPEAVAVHDDGMLSVAYGNLVGLLVEAIKELRAEVEELKKK